MVRIRSLIGFVVVVVAALLVGCDSQSGTQDAAAGRKLPDVSAAKSLSRHYVEVTFAADAGADAADPARYVIADPQGGRLAVSRVQATGDPKHVLLTTADQSVVEYGLRVIRTAQTPVEGVEATTNPDVSFAGDNGPEPCILYAIALNNTQVLITFDLAMDSVTTQDKKYYEFQPDLGISGIVLDPVAKKTAVITTDPQQNIDYSLRVTNVKSGASAYYLIDPVCNDVSFNGIPPVDSTAPRLADAQATSGHTILLRFNEPVSENAGDPSNYAISPALAILGATPNSYRTLVSLETLAMQIGVAYTVTVSNVRDLASPASNLIDPAYKSKTFTFNGALSLAPSDELPRVVNAVATSDTTVVVTFNKPMGASADVAENYRITGPETSFIFVKSALRSTDQTSVRLVTSPQTDLPYTVHVGAVRDLVGNPIAGPDSILAPPDGVDPSSAQFFGIPPSSIDLQIDTDEDGFADWFETAGWEILVVLANGGQKRAFVTSDPYNPDTDGDGFTDGEENAHNWDPRTNDTDADIIDDWTEFNILYSDPANQDSDGDGIDDLTEWEFFKTSTILADTDGDGFSDAEELFELNRNPLIADLPLPQVTVDEISLALNITSSYTDEEGVTTSVTDMTSSTFTQSRTNTLGTSDTNTTQAENTFGQKIAAEGGTAGFKISGEVSFGQSQAEGYSSTVDKQASETSQQEYQQSVTNALEQSQSRSVTRTIDSAIVQATVNIGNKSDIAFSITNIELSLLQQDRLTGRSFRPIATLRPTAASDPTGQPVYNLGPKEAARGPIIFENKDVFPNRIDDLMREPTGLVFKVVNFDVFDEAGRNLVFTSQEVSDRTVGITIDFGDGRVEAYRVATTSDFGDDGRAIGITMQRALEIIGITKVPDASTDVTNTYSTISDVRPSRTVEALVRLRDVRKSADGKKFWTAVSSNTDLDPNSDFSTIPLHAHESILVMYTSDVDGDGLFLREEYLYGSDDTKTDTDGDTLGDFDEVRTGWLVAKVPGLPYKVFSSPARPDSDLDGLDDKAEKTAGTDPNRADTDEDGRSDASELLDTYTIGLFDGDNDPSNTQVLTVSPYSDWAITAGPNGTCNTASATGDDTLVTQTGTGSKLCIASGPNGVIDTTPSGDDKKVAIAKIDPGPNGVCDTTAATGDDVVEFTSAASPITKGKIGKVCISAGLNDILDTAPLGDDFVRAAHKGLFGTDPVNADTDTDGLPDGREVLLGTNPNTRDAGKVIDTDGDGLFDQEEEDGWLLAGTMTRVTSDKNLIDTDRDGIPDVIERAVGSNPRNLDTDGDTLLDYLEFDSTNPNVTMFPASTAPMFDAVRLAEALQRCTDSTHCVYVPPPMSRLTHTNPAKADTDGDARNDNVEINTPCTYQVYGGSATQVFSNPRFADHDGDGRTDGQECVAGGTNPEDADTDDDGRSDGNEVTFSLDPLRKDKNITVTLTNIHVDGDCDGSTLRGLELLGAFNFEYPVATAIADYQFYDAPCQGEQGACDVVNVCCCKSCGDGTACEGEDISVNTSTSAFNFREGDSFKLKSTELKDNDDLGGCNGALKETIGTENETVPFAVSLDLTKAVEVGSGGCKITVNYSITTNH